MKPYGWRSPHKYEYRCRCCEPPKSEQSYRHIEKAFAQFLIEEQLAEPMDGKNACADGTCEECNETIRAFQAQK